MKETIAKLSFLVMLTMVLFSCSPAGKHPRKKLPVTLDSDEAAAPAWELSARKKLTEPGNEWSDLCPRMNKTPDQAFCQIAETTVEGRSYYSVQILGNDEAIMNIIKLYSPFADHVLDMLLNDGKEGALIDFSGHCTERAEFLIKDTRGKSFSVIFAWDRLSAARASSFMNELQQLSGITSTRKS